MMDHEQHENTRKGSLPSEDVRFKKSQKIDLIEEKK